MSTSTLGLFLRHLALSEEVGRLGTASDHDLLATYESQRGQAVFTELMRRHGPMVLRTCRRVLGRGPDAEDAFQATFVLLARKATQLRRAAKPLSLGGWLHRVAYRTAADVLTSKIRRQAHERQASAMTHPEPDPSTEATWNEIRPILDAELDALPEQSRRLLIACYLQEKTHAEAAAELGLPQGSVAWRLERARALLAARLARRGITVSALLLAVLLEESARGAGMPAVLLVHTVEAARRFTEQTAGVLSENVARLVKGGLAKMAKGWTQWSMALAGWLGLLGAGLLACQTLKAWPDQTPQSESPTAERSAQERDKPNRTDRYGDPLPPGALTRLGTVRLRHATSVHSLAFTHDGKGLITAGQGEPARLWDVASGRMVRQFGDHRDNQVYAIALSPNGRTLAGRMATTGKGLTATSDLCLWDVATGTLLRRLKAGRLRAGALAFSPDDKTVASVDEPFATLRLWEIATGKELWAVKPQPRQQITALTFSVDGKALIWAGGWEGSLHLCDVATGRELRRWDDDKKRPIRILARASDGRLFTISEPAREAEGLARLLDMTTGKEGWRLANEEVRNIATAVFSPDGKILATGHYHGPIRLWDAATGKELRRCDSCWSAPCLAFSPDGKTLASGGTASRSGDQTVHWWDVRSGREVRRADDGHQATVCSVTFTPDGQDIISSSWEGSLRVWKAATGEQRQQVLPAGDEHFVRGTIGSIASTVSSDGKTLVSATWDSMTWEGQPNVKKCRVGVRLWDRESGRELRSWSRLIGWLPTEWSFSPDGKTMACMTSQEGVVLEAATGKGRFGIAKGHLAFSPDGKLLAAAPFVKPEKKDEPGSFSLRDAATGQELCSVPVPQGWRVYHLLFSPDGRTLATASTASNNGNGADNQSGVIHLWPLEYDGSRRAGSVSDRRRVRVGPPRLLAGRLPPVVGVWDFRYRASDWVFSPDGRMLALAGEGGTILLLETASGKERTRFAGHGGDVTTLSFAPGGRRLVSGSRDTTLLVWDVTGRLQDGCLRPAQLSAKEIERLWADLAAEDAKRAGRALWTLAASPDQAVPYLEERLRTSATNAKIPRAKLSQLLRDLDDDAFAVREKAKAGLTRLGAAAEPALRQALAKATSLETRRSLEQLLKVLETEHQTPSRESLRGVRALEVLEQIGTREARAALKNLTAGAEAESALTHEARIALERLERGERR